MATGGGKNPPAFSLPLPPCPPSSSSASGSLHTPDTSTLFVRTLSTSGHSTSSSATTPASFTSLEELLNVTGINPPHSFPPTPFTPSQGTRTLQLLAKDVETKQSTLPTHPHPSFEDGLLPLKKPRLQDTPTNNFLPPKALPASLHANIRVQPLVSDKLAMSETSSKLNAHSHTISSLFTSNNSTLSSGLLGQVPAVAGDIKSTSKARVIDLTKFNTSNHSTLQQQTVTTLPGVPSLFRPPQSVPPRNNSTGSVSRDPATFVRASSPSMTTFTGPALSLNSSLANSHVSTVATPTSRPHAMSTVPSSFQRPNALSMLHQTGIATTMQQSLQTPPTSHTPSPTTLPSPSQFLATTPTRTSPTANMNTRDLALQLVQLYKQYQRSGDEQGVARVKQQLSILVKAQQMMVVGQRTSPGSLANHSIAATATAAVSANQSLAAGGAAAPRSVASVTSTAGLPSFPTASGTSALSRGIAATDLQSTPGSLQFPSHTGPPAGQGVSPSISQPLIRAPPPVQQSSTVPASAVGLPTRQGVRLGAGLSGTTRQDPSLGSPPPSLLAHIPSTRSPQSTSSTNGPTPIPQHTSTTSTITPLPITSSQAQARAEALKAALVNYRLKQLQVLIQALPQEQRPKTAEELKDLMRKYNEKLQPTPPSPLLGAAKPLDGGTKTPSSFAATLPAYSSIQSPPSQLLGKSQSTSSATPLVTSTDLLGGVSVGGVPGSMPLILRNKRPETAAVSTTGMASLQALGASSLAPPTSSSDTVGAAMAAVHSSLPRHDLQPPVLPTSTQLRPSSQQATPSMMAVTAQPLATPTQSANQASSKVATPLSSQPASHGGSIQPGVPTPLPPGVNLETLVGLCRLPEAQLLRLQLPQPLLSAISFWKMRQAAQGGSPSTSSSSGVALSRDIADDIPVIIPPQLPAAGPTPSTQGSIPAASSAGFMPHSNAQATAQVRMTSGQSGLLQNRTGLVSQASLKPLPSFLASSLPTLPPSSSQALWLSNIGGTGGLSSLQATIPFPSTSSIQQLQGLGLKVVPQTGRGSTIASLPGVGTARLQGNAVFGSDSTTTSSLPNSGVGDPIPSLARQLIPPSQGFPPRSLHSSISSLSGGGAQGLAALPAGFQRTQLPSYSLGGHPVKPPPYSVATAQGSTLSGRISTPLARPQTRYQTRAEQQKAEQERVQAFSKALQSSEEVRIAFRFGAHLEKMHQQMLQPDSLAPFRSQHDVLARLLPYHLWAEPDPPPEGTQKADGLLESVARVLLSRNQGLLSRYQQLVSKDAALEWEGGMQMCLDRLFIETEHEREEQERLEKQQAERIAADLSLIAGENRVTFDTDFSLSDIMNSDPLLGLDTGIT